MEKGLTVYQIVQRNRAHSERPSRGEIFDIAERVRAALYPKFKRLPLKETRERHRQRALALDVKPLGFLEIARRRALSKLIEEVEGGKE